jgi:hypothetical protein
MVSPDAHRAFFTGKARLADRWQIYEVELSGGRPRPVTAMDGGAMGAALISTGELVFSSPVPKTGESWNTAHPAALYAQKPGGTPRRLTYGPFSALDPTVLGDGRILFVSGQPSATNDAQLHLALFTVNNDGTEVSAFAGQHDGVAFVQRPRELPDGRVGFLAANADMPAADTWAEGVSRTRPFASRAPLFAFPAGRCRSVEPGADGSVLASLESRGVAGRSMRGSQAVFKLAAGARVLPEPLFDDPDRDDIEATPVAARSKPMGHVTAMSREKDYGTILCLDANRSTYQAARDGKGVATRIRVLNQVEKGKVGVLGEVPVQADGSFLAEVPADTPLGFETLDEQGQVLRRLSPRIWVRAGENRSCIGCHEAHNHSPRNARPIAAGLPPVILGAPSSRVALNPAAP